ncbi:MAG TPA: hypothetical protein PKI62_04945 [bacterium]|nr:hypothetical protein [bacterium]
MKRTITIRGAALLMAMMLCGCKITQITQPAAADPNSEITVQISVLANDVPEPNAHKGVLGLLLPRDWQVLEAVYRSSLGAGDLEASAAWSDSLEQCYPAAGFAGEMQWQGLISDQGYAHTNPAVITITVRLRTGAAEGCFKLGYLVTKATGGLLCSGQESWAPFSYPNRIAVPAAAACPEEFKVERAETWDRLLQRSSGWTGSDGIYSIPVDGSEQPHGQDHLILFSDTFIGQVDAAGKRVNSTIVNNTLAWLRGNRPAADSISFMWGRSGTSPRAVFTPATASAAPNDLYWLMDGIHIDSLFHVFALRLHTTGSGAFDFALNGVVILSFALDENHYPVDVQQTDLPFFVKQGVLSAALGQAILPNTRASGNRHYDGYLYIYGPRDDASGKSLIASRVLPEHILDFSQWQFWDGRGWSGNPEACAAITDRLSQEFSITEVGDRYALVFQLGSTVAIRLGDSPVGPFGFYNEIYKCPEVNISGNVFIYNAKAHPSLSETDSLLISYNVNTLSFAENLTIADIYRPRFIKLATAALPSAVAVPVQAPEAFRLLQNYPNPFNPVTTIAFELPEPGRVSLRICNASGEAVETVFAECSMPAGRYTTRWEPYNLASGVYFYLLEGPGWRETRKMMYIR